jgi:hypothetical protein
MLKEIWIKHSYLFTILFFSLGFFNMAFALLGFACLLLPFFFVFKDKEKTWCKSYCPRANLLTRIFNKRGLNLKVPKFLLDGRGKKVMLIYFLVNFSMIIMSTLMVFLDKRDPLEMVRFLIAFQLPWNIPQLLNGGFVSDGMIHLSYRVYSMMFTTTVIGLFLGLFFRPRTWCAVCPMGTLTGEVIKKQGFEKMNNNSSTMS